MRDLAQVAHQSRAHGRAEQVELSRFCTHCGSLFDAAGATPERPLRGRVCSRCGLGVVLTCASELLREPGAAFLVVTADLRISAASEAAEELLGKPQGLHGRPLLSILTSPAGVADLARRVARAAMGERSIERMPVEPAARRLSGVALEAAIGTCGSPPAALVVVEGWT
jgi:PAS domain-containing protein